MTLLYTDPIFLLHDTGRHPENAGRLRAIQSRLEEAGLVGHCIRGTVKPIGEAELAATHGPEEIDRVRRVAEAGGGRIEADTVVSAQSWRVALAAAGTAAEAVDAVLAGQDRNALCLVRPPGHHATPTRAMGFCLFNNVAVAAHRALNSHQLNRVLIVDWDVHHGNGTQDVFYEDPRVMFFSIHRYGMGFYPGTGAADETGAGPGLGCTLNAPVSYGISRKDYLSKFEGLLAKAASAIRPELIFLSAGFDAHVLDPVGGLCLEVEDFAQLTKMVLDIARLHSGGRLVSCLEGGYNPKVLAEAVQAHLEQLLTNGGKEGVP
jgi:acetoin utilization deacetylase AcuC-like enzyme